MGPVRLRHVRRNPALHPAVPRHQVDEQCRRLLHVRLSHADRREHAAHPLLVRGGEEGEGGEGRDGRRWRGDMAIGRNIEGRGRERQRGWSGGEGDLVESRRLRGEGRGRKGGRGEVGRRG